jgi:magnesium transporter
LAREKTRQKHLFSATLDIFRKVCLNYSIKPEKMKKKTDYEKNINLLPNNPVYVGDRAALEMELSVITYDNISAQINHLSGIDELLQVNSKSKISWINISGLKDIDSIKKLGLMYDIHPLTIEDILNTEQQPKVEVFKEYRFLSIKAIQREKSILQDQDKKKKIGNIFRNKEPQIEPSEYLIDQVSIIVMNDVLITIQEIPGDSFDGLRKRILDGMGEIRNMGTDYLCYAIIDSVVDEYFLTLNHLEDVIENFEDRAVKTNDQKFIEEIQDTKKYLLQVKRAILPLKDNLPVIMNREKFFQTDELIPFLHDLSENLNNTMVRIEHYREWLSNIMAVNLSVLSHQMNRVMKVLAIISTIFIPLTFVAGIYGMNFKYMPELEYAYGYPVILSCMGFILLIMIIYFKIRRWF